MTKVRTGRDAEASAAATAAKVLDARVKLAAGFAYAAAAFAVGQARGLLVLAFVGALAAFGVRIPVRTMWDGLRPVLFVVALSSAFHVLLTPGMPAAQFVGLTVTKEGLAGAGWLTARVVLVVAGLQVVTWTTAPGAMGKAVAWWLGPVRRLGLPVEELALMLTIALTFAPLLRDEYARVLQAQAARGAPLDDPNPLRRMGAVVPVVLPLFAGLLRRADELSEAMEARGYRSGFSGTRRRPAPWRKADVAVLAAALALFAWIGWRYR